LEIDKETGEVKYAPKGKGSFWISRQSIEILLDAKATALQIAAYLVMAKHTDEGGMFTTSGIKAIHKATGVSHPVIQRAVDRLSQMTLGAGKEPHLIYKADEWQKRTKTALPPAPFERAEVRYVVNDYKAKPEDKVWISNELVTGYGKFTQPLKKLKMCGDVAARLLLISYRESNLEQYGGINPRAFYYSYEMTKVNTLDGYDVWHGVTHQTTAYTDLMYKVLGIKNYSKDEEESEAQKKTFWAALDGLDKAGFIYQMVSVMDREAGNSEAQVIYELDAKSKHGYKPAGEEGLGGETARLSNIYGNPVADSMGRFYGRYAAIVPAGEPHIVGIYRLRFRVANSKNHGVATAWARIYQGQREAKEWLNDLSDKAEKAMKPKEKEPF
jgi:hypothetical protein